MISEHGLLFAQIAELPFVSFDDGFIAGSENPFHESLGLLVEVRKLALGGGLDLLCLGEPRIPSVPEHPTRQGNQTFGGLELPNECANIRLDRVTRDGLAVARTAFGLAEIIGVVFRAALRPGRMQRHAAIAAIAAIAADDKAAEREVCANLFAHRRFCDAFPALLDFLKGLKGDQRLM